MLKVGITGGIGTGKTIVCRLFALLGIPVFYADDAARALMDTDPALKAAISKLLGPEVYQEGQLNRPLVGQLVFNQPEKLAQLNALVHPATIRHAQEWMERQRTPYALKEAAIFFESGSYKEMDLMIGIDAPEELRIQRVIQRNHISREEVLLRMSRQMDNTEKMSRCNFVILNDDVTALIPQVLAVHQQLLGKAE